MTIHPFFRKRCIKQDICLQASSTDSRSSEELPLKLTEYHCGLGFPLKKWARGAALPHLSDPQRSVLGRKQRPSEEKGQVLLTDGQCSKHPDVCQQKKKDELFRWSAGKEPACNARDVGSVPGSGRCPGEGNGNPFQHPCLGNPMHGRA